MAYSNFIKAFLMNDVDGMNEFMNRIALHSFSIFDIAKNASDDDAPERFYHGFVLGLMVELAGRFEITSNRERGKEDRIILSKIPAPAQPRLPQSRRPSNVHTDRLAILETPPPCGSQTAGHPHAQAINPLYHCTFGNCGHARSALA